jgi:dolichyl-phosphate beta-glucosyltransferase
MSTPRTEFLSVVVPAYNEEERLLVSLPKIAGYCRDRFAQFEIIVADDGSTDRTPAVAEAAGARVIRLARNTGKGAAVRAGMLAANGDWILFSDADLSTPIEEFDKMLPHLSGNTDVVIGSRDMPDSQIERHQNFLRESMGKTFNLCVRLLAGLPYHDTQCGFKCYRRAAAQAIFQRTQIDGFAFDVETLVIARRLGYRVVELPVRWINCPKSKVQLLKHPAQMLAALLVIRWRDLRRRYG